MEIRRLTVGVVVHAPAKLNLFFEVLGKRRDGYHEIETLMVPVDLYDTLYFKEEPSGQVSLDCQRVSGRWASNGPEPMEVPKGAANLVVQAVKLLRRRAGLRRGAVLRLVKRIPIAAGLGGGSADAAAALVAANTGWGLNWPQTRLARLAAELGSDVPFFLRRGPAICRGRGEQVQPVSGLTLLHFVVVRPPEGLSTPDVYGACRPAQQPRRVQPVVDALARGNLAETGRLLFNRLQPAAKRLSPWIERLENLLARQDCLGNLMTGSGTCYFGLCRHARQARRAAKRLEANGVGMAFAVRSIR